MKRLHNIFREYINKKNLVLTIILSFFSIFIVCWNSAFMFNPFILVLLCVSYVFSFLSFITCGITCVITSFIIQSTYGYEILFIVLVFLLFYFLSLIINVTKLKDYIPFIFSNITIFLIYLFTSKGEFYAINSFVLLFISLLYSFVFINIIHRYRENEYIDNISFSLVISFLIIPFIKIDKLSLLILIFVLMLLLRCDKKEMYFLTSFISFVVFYLFASFSFNVLISIFIGILFTGVINIKYSYYFLLPLVSLFLLAINKTFYLDQIFYQVLIGFILSLFIPLNVIELIKNELNHSPIDNLKTIVEYQNSKFNEISKLCELLMDDRFDEFESIDKTLEKVIQKELCASCPNKEICQIKIYEYLTGYLSNNGKNELSSKCIYSYKLIKEINNLNKRIIDYAEREQKSVESRKIMNNVYQIISKYIELKPFIKKKKQNYSLDYFIISKEAHSSPNGDYVKMYDDEYQSKLLLSDGMGHTSKSKDISEYVVELVNYLHLISNDPVSSIESTNQIVLAKSYEEVYATLDFCDFDLEKGVANVYKVGSFTSFLIRNRKVKEISTNLPPLGILNSIHVNGETLNLCHNDILLFFTDGFGEHVTELIEKTIQKSSFLPLKNYVKFLYKRLLEESSVDDDKTIVGVKIIKN